MTLKKKYIAIFGGSSLLSLILLGITIYFFTQSTLTSIINDELSNIKQLVLQLSKTGFEMNQKRVDKGILVFNHFIQDKVEINYDNQINLLARNQETLIGKSITIPTMYVNGKKIYKDIELVDYVKKIVGGEATVYQLIDSGLLRVATSNRNIIGKRAIETYIPKSSIVYQTILGGSNYTGRALELKDWYITTYQPIFDNNRKVIGCISIGIEQTDLEILRNKILTINFLNKGYSYILDIDGNIVIHPYKGGANVINYTDIKGKKYFYEMIKNTITQREDSSTRETEDSKTKKAVKENKISYIEREFETNKNTPRIAFYEYLPEMEWIIVVCARKTDLDRPLIFIRIIIIIIVFIAMTMSLLIIIQTSRVIVKPILQIVDIANEIKKGNLSHNKIIVTSHDETESLAKSFNSTIDTMKELITQVYIAVITLTNNLRVLYKTTRVLTSSADEQANIVKKTVNNFDHINTMVQTVSDESNKGNDYANKALTKAQIGMESMVNLQSEMQKIEESSREISEIIILINDIAEQTNLLSLNASIESARAGEAGKGFNIVAGEIRKLAEKSTQAANKVHNLITNNNKIIKKGVEYTTNTTNILKEISQSNELITQLVKKISAEAVNVSSNSENTKNSIHHILDLAQNNLNQVENVSQALEDFVDQTVNLQKFIGQFDTRNEKVKDNQKHIEEILKAKLNDVEKQFDKHGTSFELTSEKIKINNYKITNLKLGNTIVTQNESFVDSISKITQTSVTIFQYIDNAMIRVATTIQRFDEKRAIGTAITADSDIFKTVSKGKEYFGRAFVVNRWYVSMYKPIYDKNGKNVAVLYLGIPEEYDQEYIKIAKNLKTH